MAQNLNEFGTNLSKQQFINASVSAGSVTGLFPDAALAQYLQAAINAGTYKVAGAPDLATAQMVAAAIGN